MTIVCALSSTRKVAAISPTELYALLQRLNVRFERHDHEPVLTSEQAQRLVPPIAGTAAKNLFLCDRRRRRHLLLVIQPQQRIDLKQLAKSLQINTLSMASHERLQRFLGVPSGSVSLLALANDTDCAVEVVIDRALWSASHLQCHPLVNTSTLLVSREDLALFLAHTGHRVQPMDLPLR